MELRGCDIPRSSKYEHCQMTECAILQAFSVTDIRLIERLD